MKPKGLIWTGIFVEDLKSAVTFYKDALGLVLLAQGDGWAHFDAGNGSLLELFSGGKSSLHPKTPEKQSIVIGIRVADLNATMTELKQRGVTFIGEVGDFEGTRWVSFLDPEGNQLEIKEIP